MELCDVTLREGDQLPGRDYDAEAKIAAGQELEALGVPYIQAGFPATGEKDRQVISTLADETDSQVVALARAVLDDVEAAIEADTDVIEVFAPLRDEQLDRVIGKNRNEMFDGIRASVDRAREAGIPVHLSIMDGFRTDVEYVREAIERFGDVEYVGIADTVGVRTPPSVASYLEELGSTVDLSDVGVHFHDDLGVATANVQVAYDAGVGKADVSVASLGERAGNSALEEVIAVGTIEYKESFGCEVDRLIPTCERVLDHLEESIDPRKSLLGPETTSHESGLHTAVMLEEPSLFEPFDPTRFGGERTLVFGTGTGRGAVRTLLERTDVKPTDTRVEKLLDAVKDCGPLTLPEAKALVTELFDNVE